MENGIENYYTFGSKNLSSTAQVHQKSLDRNRLINGLDDYQRLFFGNYNEISFPVLYEQEYGKSFSDMLDTGWPGLYLISEKMKVILEENKVTGWKTFEVKILDYDKKNILNYHGFSILGKCGAIDYTKSKIIQKKYVPTGSLASLYVGLHIGLDTWDGSDFLVPNGTTRVIITKRVAKLLENRKLTNIKLRNLAEVETDFICVNK